MNGEEEFLGFSVCSAPLCCKISIKEGLSQRSQSSQRKPLLTLFKNYFFSAFSVASVRDIFFGCGFAGLWLIRPKYIKEAQIQARGFWGERIAREREATKAPIREMSGPFLPFSSTSFTMALPTMTPSAKRPTSLA